MDALSSAMNSVSAAQMALDRVNQVMAEGYISAETVTAQKQAEVAAEAQVAVLKEAMAAEVQLLDILA